MKIDVMDTRVFRGKNPDWMRFGPVNESGAAGRPQIESLIGRAGRFPLPEELLGYVKCEFPNLICQLSGPYFMQAAIRGELIRATYTQADAAQTLYVKGFTGLHGNCLAFAPQEGQVASLIVREGKMTILNHLDYDKQYGAEIAQALRELMGALEAGDEKRALLIWTHWKNRAPRSVLGAIGEY